MSAFRVRAFLTALTIGVLTACEPGVDPDPVISIVVDPSSFTLAVGQTQQITVTTTALSGPKAVAVTWTTDAAAVATVSSSGLVTAVGPGTANIIATAPSGLADSSLATVTAGTPATVNKTAGDAQSAVIGTAVAIAPSVTVRDAGGNTVANVSVTFAVASGGGSVTGATQVTNATGVATVGSWVLGTTPGAQTLTATVTGIPAATFTATATNPNIVLSRSAVPVSAAAGTSPSPETVNITASTGSIGTLSLGTTTYGAGATGWLTRTISSTTAPSTLTLTVNTAGIVAGTYTATVPVQATAANNSPANVTVTLTITGTAPSISVGTVTTFNAMSGGANPTAQSVSVTNSGGGTLSGLAAGTITYGAGATGWLAASLAGTTAPTTLTLTPTLGSLAPGTYTATVPITSTNAATVNVNVTMTVAAPTPTSLAIQVAPSATVTNNTAFATQPVIRILGPSGQLATGATNDVTASIASGNATLTGNTVTAVNGTATFTNLSIVGSGNVTITFAATGLTSVTTGSIAITPGAPTHLAVSTQPAGAVSGAAFATQPVVQLRDVSGVVSPTATLAVTAAIASGSGALSGTTTVNAVNGVATFTNLVITGSGAHTLTFTASGLTAATSASFTVTLPPTQINVVTQPAGAVSTFNFTTQPVVEIRNSSGTKVAGATNSVTVAIATGSGTLSGTTTVAAIDGTATFTNLKITGTGSHQLIFTSSGLASATTASFTVAPPPPTQLAITTQPSGATSDQAFTTQPVVQIRDANGALVTSATNAVTAAIASGSGALVGTKTVSAVNGVATFTNLSISGTGPHTIVFTSAGLTSATSATVTVGSPAGVRLLVNPVSVASVPAGQNIAVPMVLDMGGAAGENVAAITFRIEFDVNRFTFVSASNGGFGSVTANTSNANTLGRIDVSIFNAEGTTTTQTLYTVTLQAKATGSTVTSPITAQVSAGGNEAGSSVSITPRNMTMTITP